MRLASDYNPIRFASGTGFYRPHEPQAFLMEMGGYPISHPTGG
jgi:hypothetical protein